MCTIEKQARINGKNKPQGRRHDNKVVNQFCMNALIMGGGKFYEILSANSGGALPSRRTVDRQIKSFDIAVHEGEVNTRLLPQVLTENQLPFRVSLAEDATSVVAIREYDINSNRIFGFSLPLSSNGTNNFKNKYCSSSINNVLYKKVYRITDFRKSLVPKIS